MQRFEGDREFRQAPGEVFGLLSDAGFLARCIPDVEKVKLAEADRAELVLRPGLAFLRGTLEVQLRVTEARSPSLVRLRVTSRGIGSSSDAEATLNLSPQGSGTRVHWEVEIKSLGGLLKMVPSGLIRGAADKVFADAWNAVEARLAGPGA
jgi:carbon monoxide dehydrogenase subunit G